MQRSAGEHRTGVSGTPLFRDGNESAAAGGSRGLFPQRAPEPAQQRSPQGRAVPATSGADGVLNKGDKFIDRAHMTAAVDGVAQIQGKEFILEPSATGGKNVKYRCRCAFDVYEGKKLTGVKRKLKLKALDGCGAYITAGMSTGEANKGQWSIRSVHLQHSNCTASANMSVNNMVAGPYTSPLSQLNLSSCVPVTTQLIPSIPSEMLKLS